jgi:hypothetical protein
MANGWSGAPLSTGLSAAGVKFVPGIHAVGISSLGPTSSRLEVFAVNASDGAFGTVP